MAQQTAVDWLVEQYANENYSIEVYEQAKQMEKKQIMNAWNNRCKQGTFISGWHIETQNGEQYYNEAYGENKD